MTAFEFTPAAERALQSAATWSRSSETAVLDLPQVLLGLLAEPECRAAQMLAKRGVDVEAVRQNWADLSQREEEEFQRRPPFSPAMNEALLDVQRRLAEYPRPMELATEHLLLGLAGAENEVSTWLGAFGLDADTLESEIHRLYGHTPGPLELEADPRQAAPAGSHSPPRATLGREAALRPSPAIESKPAQTTQGDKRIVASHDDVSPLQGSLLRTIDAAANRAGEGLRVLEDYVRFTLDDAHLTGLLKTLRHELHEALATIPGRRRRRGRNTPGDVGTGVTALDEYRRADVRDVVAANFQRVQQSLRSLEEYAKVVSPEVARRLEPLRYRAYTLERAVEGTADSRERLAATQLAVLIGGGDDHQLAELARRLVVVGVPMIQLREKGTPDREFSERARILRRITAGTPTLLVINDRADIAALAAADGVHVGQGDLSASDARSIVGPDRLVGVSTHSLEQARQAVLDGADYIGVGPTFPSSTKDFSELAGVELLAAVQREITLPAFAIGGIDQHNLAEVLGSGVTRVAVCGAVCRAADPGAAARDLLEKLGCSK